MRKLRGFPAGPGGRRGVVLLAVLAVLATGAAGGFAWKHHQTQARDAAVRQAVSASTAAAQAIFSYDYRSFDSSVANGKAFVTGDFATEYAQTTAALKQAAVAEQAVVRAEVSAAGVITATAGRVELLLYLNQYRRNVNVVGEKVDQNRVVLTMIPVQDEWKVVHAIAV